MFLMLLLLFVTITAGIDLVIGFVGHIQDSIKVCLCWGIGLSCNVGNGVTNSVTAKVDSLSLASKGT